VARKKNPNAVALGRLGGKARAQNLSEEELSAIGRKAGKLGGKARLKKLTPEQRSAIAKKAAAKRWGKKTGA
jgi:hypothetical protein